MHQGAPQITRADLAAALADIAASDINVAKALAACEAWEVGYVASLLSRAEHLAANDPDDVYATLRERALSAIDRSIRLDNPFLRVQSSGVVPTPEATDALLEMLRQQAKFHGVTTELERRGLPRMAPPTPPAS